MDGDELEQLIFFDTFSHDASEEINLDLVQFPKPVIITQVRVIPLGARVQADFPGGVRLGATNPSSFKIEFFVNDLSKHGASSFESLGLLEYRQTSKIHIECEELKIPTDGLVLRGWYTTITLAVYGFLSKPLPPPIIPDPRQEVMSASAATAEWVQSQQAHLYRDPGYNYPPDYPDPEWNTSLPPDAAVVARDSYNQDWHQKPWEGKEQLGLSPALGGGEAVLSIRSKGECWEDQKRNDAVDEEEGREADRSRFPREPSWERERDRSPYSEGRKRPKSPNYPAAISPKRPVSPSERYRSPDRRGGSRPLRPPSPKPRAAHLVEDVAGSPQTPLHSPGPPGKPDDPSFDEDAFEPILSDEDIVDDIDTQYADLDYDTPDDLEEVVKPFLPFSFQMQQLKCISDPALTSHEVYCQRVPDMASYASLKQLLDTTELVPTDDFLAAIEQLLPFVPGALASRDVPDDVRKRLIEWAQYGLKFDAALQHPMPGSKVRHLKAGVRLVQVLCHSGCVQDLVDKGVQEDLLRLFHEEFMSLSVRLLILQALDNTLLDRAGMDRLTLHSWQSDWSDEAVEATSYQNLLLMLQEKQQVRIKLSITSLLQKVHTDEVLNRLSGECADGDVVQVVEVVRYLETVSRLHLLANHQLSQPMRFLPVSAQFQVSIDEKPAYLFLYRYFRRYKLLETLQKLLENKEHTIQAAACDLLREIIRPRHGLIYLATSTACSSLLSSLHSTDENLAIELSTRLMVISCLDKLILAKEEDEVFNALHDLHSTTFSALGRIETARILAQADSMEILLKHMTSFGDKSAVKSYISDLCELTLRYADGVEYIQNNYNDLQHLFDSDTRRKDFITWIKPMEKPTEQLPVLCEVLKVHASAEFTGQFEGDLITAMRALKALCILTDAKLPENLENDLIIFKELKHKYAALQFHSMDGLSHLTTLLTKMLGFYQQPFAQSLRFLGAQGYNLLSVISPAVLLMRRLLTYLIDARKAEYKDLTHVSLLVELYTMLKAIPPSADAYSQLVSRNIVETLLLYTDSAAQVSAYPKTLWTLMLSDLVKFIIKAPYCYLPGFQLLSEMLPLPLPIQSKENLTDEQVGEIRAARQLWSAHIHPLAGHLHDVFSTLAGGSYPPLLQILRQVAVQLADLAAPTALIVAKAILDPILATLSRPEGGWLMPVSQHAARLLSFLTSLTPNPSIKSAVLSLMTPPTSARAEDKLPSLADAFSLVLRTAAVGAAGFIEKTHAQAQECILLILQSLVDCDVSLVPVNRDPARLANAVPTRDLLAKLVSSLFVHVSSPEHPISCLLFALKPLIIITDHDFGFYRIKQALQTHRDAIYQLVLRLSNEMARDHNEGFDALHTTLALLREFVLDAPTPMRTLTMKPNELARVLKWGQPDHPLEKIHSKLKEWAAKDSVLCNLCESAGDLLKLLGTSDPNVVVAAPKEEEPQLPAPMTFMEQFAVRPIFICHCDPDPKTLTASYWLGLNMDDVIEPEEQMQIDLLDLCHKFLPDLELVSEVEGVCRVKPSDDVKKVGNTKYTADLRTKRPFVTPMRGRGRQAPATRGDLFRSRPPNTSRPPSLHVDDFTALETCGQQPTGPTGYNKVSIRNVKEVIGNRGRGRGGRGFGSPYGRRGEGRGPRGRPGWGPDARDQTRYRPWQTEDLRRIHPFPR